jgi:hypothetical protein
MFGKLNRLVQVAKTAKKASKGFKTTRRNFMKGLGSLALSSALPGGVKIATATKKPLALKDAVPWVKTMTNELKTVVDANISGRMPLVNKLPNGTEIFYLKKPLNKYDSHKLSVKTADGSEDLVNFKEGKNDIEIEFDIADDFATNQYIEVNKKTGYTEMIDSNLRMAPGGEDVIKDDPIVWALEKDKHKWSDLGDTLESKDHLNDFYSVPDDTDYSHLFERYVDSFSPSGNIFNTKKYAKAEKAKNLANEKKIAERKEIEFEEQFRGGHGMHGYNIGGIVNKLKTVGSLTKGLKAAEPLGPISKGQMKLAAPKGPYSIADESGVRVLDKNFDTVEDAQKAVQELSSLRLSDPTKFKIFGARPPKTKEGVSYGAPEVKAVSKQDEARMPSMFWKSREEIAEANQNVMTGKQWLAYLKNKGVGDTELKDTSLGFHLMSTPNAKIKKSELLLEFDEMAPKIEAKVLGWRDTKSLVKDGASFINSVKRYPPVYMDQKSRRIINDVFQVMQRMDTGRPTGPQMVRLKEVINKSFKNEFGIDEIIGKGLDPAKKMPFMAKKIALVFDDILNQKGIQYTTSGKPKHAGDQTLSGGQNYQEILFSYKPGVYRQGEKIFTEGHDFGAQSPDNMFVWVRFSDRNDEYGRKILFVEEIQSDMHQGARGKTNSPGKGYVPRKDLYDPDSQELSKIQTALAKIQDKVDEAAGINVGPLRAQQAKLIKESKKLKPGKKRYKQSSDTPEGPFADSKDYGRFIMQYLLRAAKESGDYDGVALASGKIKGSSKTGFYTNIMVPQMKKIAKKSGAKYDETIIVDGEGLPRDGIPVLLLKDKKGIIASTQKMDSGISAYNKGGLVRDAFEPIVTSLT